MFEIQEHTYSSGVSHQAGRELPEGWLAKSIEQLTLYGPEAEVTLVQALFSDLQGSSVELHNEIYRSLVSAQHVLYVGSEKEPTGGVKTALFPSTSFNLFNMRVLSGDETNEEFQTSLSTNAYRFGRYMSARSGQSHSLPVMAGRSGSSLALMIKGSSRLRVISTRLKRGFCLNFGSFLISPAIMICKFRDGSHLSYFEAHV
ncbi:MAG: hypothetical protein HRT45_01670 [Bdellovibrionales bacterium]|nr:hypothetical protein [Bdellovibrionales bacterium]